MKFNRLFVYVVAIGFACVTQTVLAQQVVDASQIISDIKEGKSISYENATIRGDVDFTMKADKEDELPRKWKWWRGGKSNTVEEQITSSIRFVNCTFEDDVLAYIHERSSNYTFVANFEQDVNFSNCTFQGEAMFKYSDFEQEAVFSNTTFEDDNTFKYAKFRRNADFSGTVFEEESIFKYAKFYNATDFSKASFKDDCIFKYAEFKDGVNFMSTEFNRSLDMKYTKVRGDFAIEGMKVRDELDTKYTSINGRGFSKSALEQNK